MEENGRDHGAERMSFIQLGLGSSSRDAVILAALLALPCVLSNPRIDQNSEQAQLNLI